MQIKYMGASHTHTLEKGDNFGGRLSEGLSGEVVFSRENSWVVDSEEAGLSEEAVAVLVESGDFKDVSDAKRIPTNLHQQIFLGMSKSEAAEADDKPAGENKPEGDEPAVGSSETDATPGTTAGGSTRRSR